MASHRQGIALTLLGGFFTFVAVGASLAPDHFVAGVLLVVAGIAALGVAVWLFRRPHKRLVVPREVADAFTRSGSIMGEPPRYDSPLRRKP